MMIGAPSRIMRRMNVSKKFLLLPTTAMVLASFAALGSALPASAAGSGLELVSKQSAVDSTNAKAVTVYCPVGKVLAGAAGQINISKTGKAVLEDVTPLPSMNGATVVGTETGAGTTLNWTVKAYAICVYGLASPTLVSQQTPVDSNSKALLLTCPVGDQVVSAGGQINIGTSGKVGLHEFTPETLSTVRVIAGEISAGTTANWTMTAYALCASPPFGLQIVRTTSVIDSNHAKSVVAHCPAGKRVMGAGADITANEGNKVMLDEITPLPDLSGVNAVGTELAGGTLQNWTVSAEAICASV
jgi:hypothetical protein